MRKYNLANVIGNPTETSLAIASLIFGGALERLPNLKLCFAHAGGSLPYTRGRMEHSYKAGLSGGRESIPRLPSEYFRRLHFDTITHWALALDFLIKTVGSDKVLLGSDYPYPMGDPQPVSTVNSLRNISEDDKKRIVGGNAARLLKMSPVADT